MHDQIPEPVGCPLAELHFDPTKIVLSTNLKNLTDMRINALAPAANMRRVTPPNNNERTERFIPWFAPDNELAEAVTIRKAAFRSNPERVLNTGNDNTGVRQAARQLLELQAHYLADHYPHLYEIEEDFERGEMITNKATGDSYSLAPDEFDYHPLAIAGLLGQEDICIVEETQDGRHVMVGGFLASPTGWNLSEFVGKDMDEIHVEVDGYRERLKTTVDKSLTALPEFPDRQFARNNIFLGINPLLALVPEEMPDIDQNSITDTANQVIIRSEYETLTRLPATERYPDGNKYIIFTIEPRVYPLSTVKPSRGEELAKATVSNTVLGRKSAIAAKVIEYLNER